MKWLYRTAFGMGLMLLLLGIHISGCQADGALKVLTGEKQHIELDLSAQLIEKYVKDYSSGRWENIQFHIHFAPDNTALVQAEINKENTYDLLQMPEWLIAALPETLNVDMQLIPLLQEEKVKLEVKSLRINSVEIPTMLGDAVCNALSDRINQALEKEGLVIKQLSIEGEILRIETEKSSGP